MTIWRLGLSVAVGAAGAVLATLLGDWRYAPSIGWDACAITYCGWTWRAIWPLSAKETAEHATREDPSGPIRDVIVLIAAAGSLGALGLVVVYGHELKGLASAMLALLAVVSVAVSWFSIHTIFTLRYALLYYREPAGGIDFNQAERPDFRDFAYVALTIGMTFQVSDTDLQSSAMRATALRHALLSFLFGAVILAATVNLVAGLGG
jgi:uncharacterized membrane protein